MPMASGTDPNLLVNSTWLGSGSFSGLMPYQAPPPPAAPPIAPPTSTPTSSSGMDSAWSQSPLLSVSSAAQELPTSTSNDPLRVNSFSMTTVALQAAPSQPSPFGFSSPHQFQIGSLHGSNYSDLPTFPVDLQFNPPTNNFGVSYSVSSEKSQPPAYQSNTTATMSASDGKQNTTAKPGRKRLSKLMSSTSKAAKKGSAPTSQTTVSSMPTIRSSLDSLGPHVDMYPDSPPTTNRQTGKTLQSRPLNESPRDSSRKSPNTPHSFYNPTQTTSLSTSSTTPMSPSMHILTNKPGRFRSSPLSLPSSLPSTTFSSLTTKLKSPTCSTGTTSILSPFVTSPTALSTPSLTAQPGVTVSNASALPSSSYKVQDVNSLEYRKLILERVQEWNEHKQKMMQMQGRAECSKLKSPTFQDGSILSPASGDIAYPDRPSDSVNFSPSLIRSFLVSSPMDSPGLASRFKVAVSSADASRESSPTSTILSSPKLLTAGPPITFADTLAPRPNSKPPSSLELESPSTTSESTSITPSSPDLGDISSMSRWELEQLYKHNMEKLEQQKKYISILEAQLKRLREQRDTSTTQKPSESELYKRCASFVVEPEMIPDASSICSDKFGYGHLSKQSNGAKTKPTPDFNEVIRGGTFDRPVLNEEYDFYANFGRS